VGLTTGVALAYLGHEVLLVEKDPVKLELLQRFESPIHEPGLEVLLPQVRSRLGVTDRVQEAVGGVVSTPISNWLSRIFGAIRLRTGGIL